MAGTRSGMTSIAFAPSDKRPQAAGGTLYSRLSERFRSCVDPHRRSRSLPDLTDVWLLPTFFARQVAGGALLGLAFGDLGSRTLKSLDDHPLAAAISLIRDHLREKPWSEPEWPELR
jgi:hypothetical protein